MSTQISLPLRIEPKKIGIFWTVAIAYNIQRVPPITRFPRFIFRRSAQRYADFVRAIYVSGYLDGYNLNQENQP